jgi:hypothetical protein
MRSKVLYTLYFQDLETHYIFSGRDGPGILGTREKIL